MKALVVDDSRLARNELKRLLKEFDKVEVMGEAANAMEAKEKIENDKPDLIFLDIQMPGKNGFELLEELEFMPEVIFTTAYDEYAIKAFEYNALDYLQKPVQKDRLAGAGAGGVSCWRLWKFRPEHGDHAWEGITGLGRRRN